MKRTGFNICAGESGERTNLLLVQGWDIMEQPLIGAKRHIERLFKVKLNG